MIKTIEDELRDVEDALLHVKTAQGLVDCQHYQPLIKSLEQTFNAIKTRFDKQRAVLSSEVVLRPVFRVVGKPKLQMRCVVFKPEENEIFPFINEGIYNNLRRLVCALDYDTIEVCSKYDVVVRNKYREIIAVIKASE